jgi:hypothetical protein
MEIEIISPYIYPGIRRTDLPAGYTPSQDPALITQEIILDSIEEILNLNYQQIASPTRSSLYVTARIFYCYLMRKHLNWSLKEIGSSINRDHTTVIHSLRNYEDYLLNEEVFRSTNKAIEEAVANRRCPIVYKIRTSRYEKHHSQVLEVS